MKRFIEKTSYFLLMIITLLALTACVLQFVGFDNYIVVSGSMEPNIPTGSFAVVNRNADFDDVKIGDVIVFKYEYALFSFRADSFVELRVVAVPGKRCDKNFFSDLLKLLKLSVFFVINKITKVCYI